MALAFGSPVHPGYHHHQSTRRQHHRQLQRAHYANARDHIPHDRQQQRPTVESHHQQVACGLYPPYRVRIILGILHHQQHLLWHTV